MTGVRTKAVYFALAAAVAASAAQQASASQIANYTFSATTTTASTATTPATADSTVTDPNSTPGTFTAGVGLIGQGSAPYTGLSTAGNPGNSYFVRSSGTDGSNETTTIAANDYLTFTVTPNSGATLNLTSLTFDADRNNQPPNNDTFFIRSSVDGFSTTLGTFTNPSTTTTWTPESLTLGAAFQALTTTPVEFRIYVFDDGNTDALVNRIDNVVLNGTSTPEPASLALLGAGALGLLARRRRRA